jgi:hypothetical protein
MPQDFHRFAGYRWVNKFGRNPDIDAAAEEDVWGGGGTWTAPTTARIHDLTSANTNDTAAGSGARAVLVEGLDANWHYQTEIVVMNGTSNVETASTYRRIYMMTVQSLNGGGGTNAGNITATAQTDSTVTAIILAGNAHTHMAIYTVAEGTHGYITNYYAGMNKNNSNGTADTFLFVREAEVPGPWVLQHIMGLAAGGSSYFIHTFDPYFELPEKYDVKIRVGVSANNTDISAGFDIISINR